MASEVRDIRWIMSVLPHRYPMLLVDKVLELETDRHIVAEKCFTANEFFFAGHFPGHPVVPGVLLIEGLAQAGGILLLHDRPSRERELLYFMSIDRARFRHPVVPGDVLRYEVELLRKRQQFCKLSGRGLVGDTLCVEATCTSGMVDRDDA